MELVVERRRRPRIKLRCTLRVSAVAERGAIDGQVINISSQGLYWISEERFVPGQLLRGWIAISGNGNGALSEIRLRCSLVVVRTEQLAQGFGVACRLEDISSISKASREQPVNGDEPAASQRRR